MSLFHLTLRKLVQPHDLRQIQQDIEHHTRAIREELRVEHVLGTKLQRYCELLEEARRLAEKTFGGMYNEEAKIGYDEAIRAAHAMTLEIENEIERSRLPQDVKDKWLRLVFK